MTGFNSRLARISNRAILALFFSQWVVESDPSKYWPIPLPSNIPYCTHTWLYYQSNSTSNDIMKIKCIFMSLERDSPSIKLHFYKGVKHWLSDFNTHVDISIVKWISIYSNWLWISRYLISIVFMSVLFL